MKLLYILFAASVLPLAAHAEGCKLESPFPIVVLDYRGDCQNGLANGNGRAVVQFPKNTGDEIFYVEGEFQDGHADGKVLSTTESGKYGYSGTVSRWVEQDGKGYYPDGNGTKYLEFRRGRVVARESTRTGPSSQVGSASNASTNNSNPFAALAGALNQLSQTLSGLTRQASPGSDSNAKRPSLTGTDVASSSTPLPSNTSSGSPDFLGELLKKAINKRIEREERRKANREIERQLAESQRPNANTAYGTSPPVTYTTYGNSPPVAYSTYGTSTPAGYTTYGNSPSVGYTTYGSSPPHTGTTYGTSPPVTYTTYGNSPPVGYTTYGSSPQPGNVTFGNSAPTGNVSFGNVPPPSNTTYGNSPPPAQTTFGNSPPVGYATYGNSHPPANTGYVQAPTQANTPPSTHSTVRTPPPSTTHTSSPPGQSPGHTPPTEVASISSPPVRGNAVGNSGSSMPTQVVAASPESPSLVPGSTAGIRLPPPTIQATANSTSAVGGDLAAVTTLSPGAFTEKPPSTSPPRGLLVGAPTASTNQQVFSQADFDWARVLHPKISQKVLALSSDQVIRLKANGTWPQMKEPLTKASSTLWRAQYHQDLMDNMDAILHQAWERTIVAVELGSLTTGLASLEAAAVLYFERKAVLTTLKSMLVKRDGTYIGRKVGSASDEVRTLTKTEFEQLKAALLRLKSKQINPPGTYPGSWYELAKDTEFGFRVSRDWGETIDVVADFLPPGFRIHF